MKKKIIALLLFSAVVAGSAYAQEEEMAKNRIAVSAGIIIGDISYERMFSPNFSVLAQVSYNNFFLIADSFSVAAKGRWYPFGGVFFLDLGLGYSFGYNIFTDVANIMVDTTMMILSFGLWALSDEYKSRNSDSNAESLGGFFLQPGLGWNIDIGKKDGFRLPIALGLDIRFAEINTFIPNLKIGLSYSF